MKTSDPDELVTIDYPRASEKIKSLGITHRKPKELKPGENEAALCSLLAWVLGPLGCCLILVGMSLGQVQLVIGVVTLCVGIVFGVCSRTIKKKS